MQEEEEDNDDELWHDAREDGWESEAGGEVEDEAGTEPEGEEKGRVGEDDVGNRHDRFGWDAIRAWIGQSKRDRGMNGGKAREGSSTPDPETSAVRPLWQHKIEEKEGGGEGTRATMDEGAENTEHDIVKDVRGQAVQRDVPRDGTTTSEVMEASEAKNTDAEVGEATYLFWKGTRRGAEYGTCNVAA